MFRNSPGRPARGGWAFRLGLTACLLVLAMATSAASLQVSPILVEFTQDEQSQAMWLANTDNTPLRVQVRVADWSQAGGKDVETPSKSLVASPAILEIPPGGQQLVRLVRTQASPSRTEIAYRLTIDELPAEGGARKPGLQLLLRYSVPVFVTPAGMSPLGPTRRTAGTPPADPASLSIRLEPVGEASVLRISNPGIQRVRLSHVAWTDDQGKPTVLAPGLLGYVLAGQSMQWSLPLSPALRAKGGRLTARINDNATDQALPLDGPGG